MQVRTSYLVCSTARTGSTLLCEALRDTGIAGRPGEYFYEGVEQFLEREWGRQDMPYVEYLNGVMRGFATPNGIWGAKVMWVHFEPSLARLHQIPEYVRLSRPELLSHIFPSLHYIWITRRDKVRQAVSQLKAMQTGVWKVEKGETPVPAQEPRFDFDAIDFLVQANVMHEVAWQEYFAEGSIIPFTVVYEDLVAELDQTILRILEYLGIPLPDKLSFGEGRLEKQADSVSEEWCQRYLELKGEWIQKQTPIPAVIPPVTPRG